MAANAPSPTRPRGRPVRTLIVGLVILVGGLLGLVPLGLEWGSADASSDWPSTRGAVTSSSLSSTKHVRAGSSETWTVHVSYSYKVGGASHVGTAIHKGGFPSYDSKSEARAVLSRYGEGAAVTVFYDPSNPSDAVLEPGVGAATGSLGVGALLVGLVVALGTAVVVQSVRRIRAERAPRTG
jgi:uncharacterized protein DUF3592